METPEQPGSPVSPPPCVGDDAVDPVYDAAQFGTCANGHPLNRAGRCYYVNTPYRPVVSHEAPDTLAPPA